MNPSDFEWNVLTHWADGLWRASAIGPKGGRSFVTISASSTSADGARALVGAMLRLKMSTIVGEA